MGLGRVGKGWEASAMLGFQDARYWFSARWAELVDEMTVCGIGQSNSYQKRLPTV